MPAATVASLSAPLARYVANGADLLDELNILGPRVYALGHWRDLIFDAELVAGDGIVYLPDESDSILSAMLDGVPVPVRAQWHDYRARGLSGTVLEQEGLIDAGWHALNRLFSAAADEFSVTLPVDRLHVRWLDGTVPTSAELTDAGVEIVGITEEDLLVTGVLTFESSECYVLFSSDIDNVKSVTGKNLPAPVLITLDGADATSEVGRLASGSTVARFRWFRVPAAATDSHAQLHLKRKWQPLTSQSDVIHLGNLAVWQHALLAKVAEDNADLERATYHWQVAQKLLDDELLSSTGAAMPVLMINPVGDWLPQQATQY